AVDADAHRLSPIARRQRADPGGVGPISSDVAAVLLSGAARSGPEGPVPGGRARRTSRGAAAVLEILLDRYVVGSSRREAGADPIAEREGRLREAHRPTLLRDRHARQQGWSQPALMKMTMKKMTMKMKRIVLMLALAPALAPRADAQPWAGILTPSRA